MHWWWKLMNAMLDVTISILNILLFLIACVVVVVLFWCLFVREFGG